MGAILPTRAATITWTNSGGGNWKTPLNWSPTQVPGASDTAVFSTPGTYSVFIAENESVSNLDLGSASGTVTLSISSGTFTVNGAGSDTAQDALNLSGGTITGPGSLIFGGPLTWTQGSIECVLQCGGGSVNAPVADANAPTVLGFGGQLINTGTMTWVPTSGPRTGGGSGTVISNAASGVINITLNGNSIDHYVYGGATAFYNAGQINIAGAGQSGSVTAPFINTGTVTVSNGTFELSGGGTNTGLISVESGGTFNFSAGTFTSETMLSGAGNLEVSGGIANLAGTNNLTGAWIFSGGTANLTGLSMYASTAVTNSGGTVNLDGPGPWLTGTVALSFGTLAGTSPLVDSGPLYWTGGSIECVLSCIGGSINVPVTDQNAPPTVGFGGQLINAGPMTWVPTTGPRTGGGAGTVISNAASGVISITLNGNNIDHYSYGGTTAFYNAGQINISGAGQSGSISDPFINTGTVTIYSGTFGTSDGGTNGGLISVQSGGTFNPNGGTFSSGTMLSGAGDLVVSGGTANLAGGNNLTGDWTFSGGTANLNGFSLFPSTALTNSGATVNFNGPGPWLTGTVALSFGTLAGSSPLVDGGPLYWTGGSIECVLQCAGGSVNAPVSDANAPPTVGFGGQLLNTGTMTWITSSGPRTGGGAGTVISNAASGTINVTLSGNNNIDHFVDGGTAVFYNAGQINISGAGQSGSISDPFINTGTVTVSSGTFGLGDGGTNNGLISVQSDATFNPNGGVFYSEAMLSGAGNLAVSGGTANLGGTINLTGTWTFSGGTANLTGLSSSPSTALTNSGGNASFTGPGPWLTGMLTVNSGTLTGTTPLVASGPLDWTYGNIDAIVQCNGGIVNVVGQSETLGYGAQLINTGTLTWTPNVGPETGGNNPSAPIQTLISNAPGGTINITLNGNNIDHYGHGGATAFCNAGQINISGAGQGGSITDPFINTGTLNIQSGTLSVTGGYSSTNGTLDFGITSTANFGHLALSGPVALNGALDVIPNGYTPALGDSFPLITYGSETGAFTAFSLPSAVNWRQTYGSTVYTLSAVATPEFVTLTLANPVWTAGGFNLEVFGPAGSNYMVQVSTNLGQPNWATLTNFVSTFIMSPVTDSTATNFYPCRFYRAVMN